MNPNIRREVIYPKYTGLEHINPDQGESVWGQMLYVGHPSHWMAPEPLEGEDVEPDHGGVEPIFHLPPFLREPSLSGDVYVPRRSRAEPRPPPARQAYPGRDVHYAVVPPPFLYVSHALVPHYPQPQYPDLWPAVPKAPRKPSERAPRWPHYNDPVYTQAAPPAPHMLAPPWPHYNHSAYNTPAPPAPLPMPHMLAQPWAHSTKPRLHVLPSSPPPCQPPKYSPPRAAPPRVFHPPTPAELSARLDGVRAQCNQRALAAKIPAQKARDAEAGFIALPSSPPPPVFVLPFTRPSTPTRTSSRSPTPFRLLPPLSARFPRYFAEIAAHSTESTYPDEESDEDSVDAADVFDWPHEYDDEEDIFWDASDSNDALEE